MTSELALAMQSKQPLWQSQALRARRVTSQAALQQDPNPTA